MRIVIKLGTQVLLNKDQTFSLTQLENFVRQIVILKSKGFDVILVSSGALGTGKSVFKSKSDVPISKQVLSSLGQAELIHNYNKLFKEHGYVAAQVLVTKEDFKTRERYLNIRDLFETSFNDGSIIPVLNENDPVTMTEKSFTDNDELSGLVAAQIKAKKLIMLTGANGVYDRAPDEDGAVLLQHISPDDDLSHLDLNGSSSSGRGGIRSKLNTALNASEFGIETHIASGFEEDVLIKLLVEEEDIGTIVRASNVNPNSSFKRWLATDISQIKGSVIANQQLSDMIQSGDTSISILPVGLREIEGEFERDDLIRLKSHDGQTLGQGIARYDSKTLETYLEQQNKPVFIRENKLYLVQR